MRRVRIKFCGITSAADAMAAVALGVDALGFVFYEPSPRFVTPAAAASIIQRLPPFVTAVGLFVNATPQEVRQVADSAGIHVLQFHGDETGEYCRGFDRPWIKAVRVRAPADVTAGAAAYAGARALLLDAYDDARYGGTGRTFDWSAVPVGLELPVILAGGLSAANVAAAIRTVGPYAVDVSGGIESAKGVKDPEKMKKFVTEVARFER